MVDPLGYIEFLAAQRAATVVDAIRQATPGTLIGLGASALVLLIGLWLMTRRVS